MASPAAAVKTFPPLPTEKVSQHELVQRCDEIVLQVHEDDVPTLGIMRLAEQSGALDSWLQEGEDIYSAEDGEPV